MHLGDLVQSSDTVFVNPVIYACRYQWRIYEFHFSGHVTLESTGSFLRETVVILLPAKPSHFQGNLSEVKLRMKNSFFPVGVEIRSCVPHQGFHWSFPHAEVEFRFVDETASSHDYYLSIYFYFIIFYHFVSHICAIHVFIIIIIIIIMLISSCQSALVNNSIIVPIPPLCCSSFRC